MEDFAARDCPACGSSKSIQPSLVLLYSRCCGTILCLPCCSRQFSSSISIPCPGNCGCTIHHRDFKNITYGQQQYDSIKHGQKLLEPILNPTRQFFDTDADWDKHLETLGDILDAYVHESPEAAKVLLDTYVNSNFSFFARFTGAGTRANIEAESSQFIAWSKTAMTSYELPQRIAGKSNSDLSPRSKSRRNKMLPRMRKIASGFNPAWEQLKSSKLAFKTLFDFPLL